jgi:hypothetical protein
VHILNRDTVHKARYEKHSQQLRRELHEKFLKENQLMMNKNCHSEVKIKY